MSGVACMSAVLPGSCPLVHKSAGTAAWMIHGPQSITHHPYIK